MNQLKLFTVEEANALLPQITELLHQLQEVRSEVALHEVEVDAVELVADKDDNGSSPVLDKKLKEYQDAVNRFYSLVNQIHELGCVLKDVDHGLIDFYSRHEGRIVYLCWKLGEDNIGHWHDIGKGFSHRQTL